MYVVSWSLIEVQSNEKNDALAFNGCKGQKKKMFPLEMQFNTLNLQLCSNHPFIWLYLWILSWIRNRSTGHLNRSRIITPPKFTFENGFVGFLDIITVKLSQEKKGGKCRIKMNLMAKSFFSTLNVYTKLQKSNEIQCCYSISFEKPSSLEFILFLKKKVNLVLPKYGSWAKAQDQGLALGPWFPASLRVMYTVLEQKWCSY